MKFFNIISSTIFIIAVFVPIYKVYSHKCIHNHVKDKINTAPKLSTKPDLYSKFDYVKGTKRRNLNSVPWNPLRILVIYKFENSPLNTTKRSFLKDKLLPNSVEYWRQALSIRRPDKLLVEGTCTHVWTSNDLCAQVLPVAENLCADIPIDTKYIARHAYYEHSYDSQPQYEPAQDGAGTTEYDYILYVTADATPDCSSDGGGDTLAYAANCRRDSNGRPVMGYSNFCPNQVDDTDANYWQQYKTAKHEIAHALGFTSDSWPLMRNSDGSERTTNHALQSHTCANGANPITQTIDVPSTSTISSETKRGKNVRLVATERVKEVARAYYNCSSINGAELEDQIGSGCLGSHWEERTMFDELMSPLADDHYSGNRVSKFTLALFEDTGWYKANYTMADSLKFGRNAGCDFLNEKCINPTTGVALSVPKYTFCSTPNEQSCTFDLTGYGYCAISSTWSADLPSIFQYFPSQPTKGGIIQHVDFCPMYTMYSNTDCKDAQWNGNGDTARGDLFGMKSFCAYSSLFDAGYTPPVDNKYEPNCYQMECFANNTIQVTIRRKRDDIYIPFNCYSDGQEITVAGYLGKFICPRYDDICATNVVGVNLPGLPDIGDSGGVPTGPIPCESGTDCLKDNDNKEDDTHNTTKADSSNRSSSSTALITILSYVFASIIML